MNKQKQFIGFIFFLPLVYFEELCRGFNLTAHNKRTDETCLALCNNSSKET